MNERTKRMHRMMPTRTSNLIDHRLADFWHGICLARSERAPYNSNVCGPQNATALSNPSWVQGGRASPPYCRHPHYAWVSQPVGSVKTSGSYTVPWWCARPQQYSSPFFCSSSIRALQNPTSVQRAVASKSGGGVPQPHFLSVIVARREHELCTKSFAYGG
jgi:hypothetical protein